MALDPVAWQMTNAQSRQDRLLFLLDSLYIKLTARVAQAGASSDIKCRRVMGYDAAEFSQDRLQARCRVGRPGLFMFGGNDRHQVGLPDRYCPVSPLQGHRARGADQ